MPAVAALKRVMCISRTKRHEAVHAAPLTGDRLVASVRANKKLLAMTDDSLAASERDEPATSLEDLRRLCKP